MPTDSISLSSECCSQSSRVPVLPEKGSDTRTIRETSDVPLQVHLSHQFKVPLTVEKARKCIYISENSFMNWDLLTVLLTQV